MHRQFRPVVVACLLVIAAVACRLEQRPPAPIDSTATDTTRITLANWEMEPIPDGPIGESIRRGLAILTATNDSLPEYVGNDLNCMSCHLEQGSRPNGLPLVGVYARFPQYNARAARVFNIEDRINGCLVRSMNGKPMPDTARAMRDMVSWMAHVSKGLPVGGRIEGLGVPRPDQLAGDTVAGAETWLRVCAACHGRDGQGTPLAPPTWGPRSFNIGAGMARIRTAAGFIRHNMPNDRPGTLTDQQALDVAAYLVSRPRPDLPGKEKDWPNGGAPPDVAYPVTSQR